MRILVTGASGVIGTVLCHRNKVQAERPRHAGECIALARAN
jgi:nucleoside-diphosphate-sugar epimerase